MTKRLVLSAIILLIISYNAIAEVPEILIKPTNEEYTRLSTGLAGSNISIITSDQLSLRKNDNIQKILEDYSGIEIRKYYGGIENVKSGIDMRGFGEASISNVLVLLNGNRLNNIDMSSVDLSNIPLESIERIEIIRGGSGSTLYGSGAVGGTINIVTKNSSKESSINSSYGSYNSLSGEILISRPLNENNSILLSSKMIETDTFRNSADYKNESYLLNLSNIQEGFKINLDIATSSIEQQLPGPRVIGGVYNYHFCNLYGDSKTNRNIGGYSHFDHPEGAEYGRTAERCNTAKRVDYADSESNSYNGGILYTIDELNKLQFNLGYKDKTEKSFYGANANTTTTSASGDRYSKTDVDGNLFNLAYENKFIEQSHTNSLKIGYDFTHSFYNSNRHRKEDEAVGHFYDADIKSEGIYFQNTAYINDISTAISFGVRSEDNYFKGRDTVDRNVSGFASIYSAQDHSTYNNKTSNTAYNLGIDNRINENLSFYGQYSAAFRIPNIDERILTKDYANTGVNGDFILKDQESDGYEIGLRYENMGLSLNASFFDIETTNEIQYNQSVNANLDPIKREGINLDFNNNLDSNTRINGSFSYVNAEFTSGELSMGTSSYLYDGVRYYTGSETYGYLTETALNFMGSDGTENQVFSLAGKKVPLVAPIKVNIGLERELINEYELLIDLSYVDERYVSNDQENVEPKMPDYYLVDLYVNNNNNFYDISFGVNNLFDEAYYDFAISSVFHDDAHYGTRNVYPLPGRNFFVNLGYTF